jgi:AraC-like DNA-binding protein
MVCRRCILVVRSELEKLGLHPVSIELGKVILEEDSIDTKRPELDANLRALGFEIIDDKKSKTIDKIKTLIIELIHKQDNNLNENLSKYLSVQLTQDYNSLSNLFSEVTNTTIEKYFIAQKIERVKELLMYDELTLKEIAFKLNYSSVAYLSNQFRKITGFSPSYYKQLKNQKRKQIEDL